MTLQKLAEAEQVRPPTMTRIVNALELKRLVTRRKNESDGRSVIIAATNAGRRLLLEARRRRIRALVHQIDALSRDERSILDQATRILAKVLAGMR
jgi:DNA-binding MarR family transcriptional regulator